MMLSSLNFFLLRLASVYYTYRYNKRMGSGSSLNWRLIVAIAYHETGGFKSSLWKRARNGFGMKVAYGWKQHGNGVTNGYVSYFTAWSSVRDYFIWCERNNLIYASNYLWISQMKMHGYFEDTVSNYYNGVLNGLENVKGFKILVYVMLPLSFMLLYMLYSNRKFVKQWITRKFWKK